MGRQYHKQWPGGSRSGNRALSTACQGHSPGSKIILVGKSWKITHTHTSASMCYNTFLFPQTVYLRGSQFFLKRWPALSRWLCPALFTWFHSFSPSVPSGVQLSGCLFSLVSPISQPGWSCPGSPDVSLSFLSLHMSPPSCLSSLVSRHFIPSLTGD